MAPFSFYILSAIILHAGLSCQNRAKVRRSSYAACLSFKVLLPMQTCIPQSFFKINLNTLNCAICDKTGFVRPGHNISCSWSCTKDWLNCHMYLIEICLAIHCATQRMFNSLQRNRLSVSENLHMLIWIQTCTWKGMVNYEHSSWPLHMHVPIFDSFRNKLKTVYLDGKVNGWKGQWMDWCATGPSLRVEHDSFYRYELELKHRLLLPNRELKVHINEECMSISPEKVTVSCCMHTIHINYQCIHTESLWYTMAYIQPIRKPFSRIHHYQNSF